MAKVLGPYVTDSRGSFKQLRYGDGGADVYLSDDSMMANHISGKDVWDLLLQGAQAANWVIMPMDCPTCLTAPGQLEQLPEGLEENVVGVATGAELRAVIEAT